MSSDSSREPREPRERIDGKPFARRRRYSSAAKHERDEPAGVSNTSETEHQENSGDALNAAPSTLHSHVLANESSRSFEAPADLSGSTDGSLPIGLSKQEATERTSSLTKTKSSKESPTSYKVNLKWLKSVDLGEYEFASSTTLRELRQLIRERHGVSTDSMVFVDLTTKCRLKDEKNVLVGSLGTTVITEKGIDVNAAISGHCIQGEKVVSIQRGAQTFQVMWWNPQLKANREVTLIFAETRIYVSQGGTMFNIFDSVSLRKHIEIQATRNTETGFQLAQLNANGQIERAAIFHAAKPSVKTTIFLYFCFVWRPRAVRRGWMPPTKHDIIARFSETNPFVFTRMLKKHLREVTILTEKLESTKDPRVIQSCIELFWRMFRPDGELAKQYKTDPTSSSQSTEESSNSGDSRTRAFPRHDQSKRLQKTLFNEVVSDAGSHGITTASEDSTPSGEDDEDDITLQPLEPQFLVDAQALLVDIVALPDGVPPPPPAPPRGSKTSASIFAVNFDSIPVSLIKGTIFEQSVAFNLASATQESLIQDAKEVFVRASTKSKQSKLRGLADVSQLDGNRLRNLEILMRSDELKQLTVDELVDGLLTADDRIFGKLSVLERLARREMKTGVMVLIPTKAEEAYVRELFDEMQRNNQDAHEILRKSSRNAELFLLRITQEIPDLENRLTFAHACLLFTEQCEDIKNRARWVTETCRAIRGAKKLPKLLRLVTSVLTTLHPQNGLTAGFRLSTFLAKVDHTFGFRQTGAPDSSKREGIKISLIEYIANFVAQFPEVHAFWKDVKGCARAQTVDVRSLGQETSKFAEQLARIEDYLVDALANKPTDPFTFILRRFSAKHEEVAALHATVTAAQKEVAALWEYFGETDGQERTPELIFKYIYDFAFAFKRIYKDQQSSIKNDKQRTELPATK